MPAGPLSQLLLNLHAGATAAPVEQCRETLLAALRHQIPFDNAIWGSGAENPQLIFGIATLDFPLERLIDYATWQSQDALRTAVGSRPGTALRNEDIATLAHHYASAIYQGYCAPAGLHHTLGIAEVDPVTSVGELVFLFRSDHAQPFPDAQRDLLEQAMPHMVAAWRHRMLREFASKSGRTGSLADLALTDLARNGHAVIDAQGHVHASDAAFGLAMRAAFPAWLGPLLPAPLREAIRAETTLLKAGCQSFQLLRGHNRHILRLADPAQPQLSTAEHRVATLFAQGLTAQQTATRLNLSPLTVRNHITAIYAKLNLHSKTDLARYMQQLEN